MRDAAIAPAVRAEHADTARLGARAVGNRMLDPIWRSFLREQST
jgi:hypothetical protein